MVLSEIKSVYCKYDCCEGYYSHSLIQKTLHLFTRNEIITAILAFLHSPSLNTYVMVYQGCQNNYST